MITEGVISKLLNRFLKVREEFLKKKNSIINKEPNQNSFDSKYFTI